MAVKNVKISLRKNGNGYKITIKPWKVIVSKQNSDSIRWTSDAGKDIQIEEVVVDFGTKQHFEDTPSKIEGSANPATDKPIKNFVDNREYTYALKIYFNDTVKGASQRIVIDPDYVVQR